MKNRLFERNRKLQKVYAAKRKQPLEGGITVRHCYNENHDFDRTWWDDSGFYLNGRYIAVWLVHPRMEFSDKVDELVHDNVPRVRYDSDLFEGSVPRYKMVGKSKKRKKRDGYTGNRKDNTSFKEWYDAVQVEKKRLLATTNLIIQPQIKVDNLDWCRGVSIVAPIEVHGYEDLKALCALVKRILKGQTTLSKEFPDYSYRRADWAAEELKFTKD